MKKNIIKIIFLSSFFLLSLLSCSETEPLDESLVDYLNQESISNVSFSAMIDGQPFTANDITAFYNINSHTITILGHGFQDSENLILNVKANNTGVYPMELLPIEINEFEYHSTSRRYSEIKNQVIGVVSISNFNLLNKTLSGHFEGVLNANQQSKTKSITNGVFSNVSFVIMGD